MISIHVPLAGHDLQGGAEAREDCISIHVPLAGHDIAMVKDRTAIVQFQSTCPLRGTTTTVFDALTKDGFQSTCPLRGTTRSRPPCRRSRRISIHVPLAGHDRAISRSRMTRNNFNPRAPCGARRWEIVHSARGQHFNPRAPCGARPVGMRFSRFMLSLISIHVPLAGHDIGALTDSTPRLIISIHVPLAGHDPERYGGYYKNINFNPRAPCGARRRPGDYLCV